jgi:L-alanine-DL-glutamate epimerase-like enolase superfamily enzyme
MSRAAQQTAPRAPALERLDVSAFTIPTDAPESDGTIAWNDTTIVIVEASAAGITGIGYTYADRAAADVIRWKLADAVHGRDSMDVEACYVAMMQAVRNIGREGIAACAVSAVDIALWDLKAKRLGLSLAALLGRAREAIPVYGSGGFTSYTIERLQAQLGGWVSEGINAVKMKVGRNAAADRDRVAAAREAIGAKALLMVDANGAYDRKLALGQADAFGRSGATWFEEPVSSDDLEGLRFLRDRAPAGMEIAAGEYGYHPQYFRRMLDAGAVDVLQADATRCGGVTGFMRASALCDAFGMPLSAHTAPSVHAHLCCAASRARNLEYFHDHVRIERLLFTGVLVPEHGMLRPDDERPGLGIELDPKAGGAFGV